MASGPLLEGGGDDGSRDKHRWAGSKVYTRKSFNKKSAHKPNPPQPQPPSSLIPTATEDRTSSHHHDAASDDSSSLNPTNGSFFPLTDNRVTINLSFRSKQDLRELRRKLSNELAQVRAVVTKLDALEHQPAGYSHSQLSANNPVFDRRGNSDAAPGTPRNLQSLRQLSVSVANSQGGGTGSDVAEKEKRTPKANQFYRNSDFLLGKEKLPPPDSHKKLKSNGSKKHHSGADGDFGAGAMDKKLRQVFKNCDALLSKLMKHVHGWVFNKPVDAKGLGLHDYHSIIKHPMDLSTVKGRLTSNWYKSPKEFAEDVRLTFRNAMTYNPKGQDVHIMAEQLLGSFEEQWASIEADYNLSRRFNSVEVGFPTSHLMKKGPPPEFRRTLDRSESMTIPTDSKLKAPLSSTPGRKVMPKKPKAKDPNKRDMTYEEKQKLSTNLLNLPMEKLDNIVQIIKKRNLALNQHDNEIEVDIDSFDAETLWELDRFVTNYKKSLSKNKKKAELAMQMRGEAKNNNVLEVNPVPITAEVLVESKMVEKNAPSSSPVKGEKHGDNASRSSSSSSSSSDSGSSSSDSDSESSTFGSDAPRSPRT